MRTDKTDNGQFIIVDFDYLDSNTTSAIGITAEGIYLRIVRKAWRHKGKRGDILHATINQAHMAKDMGLSRKTVNDHIKILEKIGWVKKVGDPKKSKYEVGYYPNLYYSQRETTKLVAAMEKYALDHKPPLVNTKGDPSITKISSAMRTEMVQEWYGIKKGKSSKSLLEKNLHKEPEGDSLEQNLLQGAETGVKSTQALVTNLLHNNSRENGIGEESSLIGEDFGSLATPDASSPERSEGEPDLEICRDFQNTEKSVKQNSAAWTRCVNDLDETGSTPELPRSRPKTSEPRLEDIRALARKAKEEADKASGAQLRKTQQREAKRLNLLGKPGDTGSGMKILERLWEKGFKRNFPDLPFAKWEGKERGQAKALVDIYDGPTVRHLFDYMLDEWNTATETFKKKPTAPTIGWIRSLHTTFVPAAITYAQVKEVLDEWNQWWEDNPDESSPPADLQKRFNAKQKEMKELGLLR